ncbi:MAG: hypothetical protein AB8H86_12725 [Polyangiales bacterium]
MRVLANLVLVCALSTGCKSDAAPPEDAGQESSVDAPLSGDDARVMDIDEADSVADDALAADAGVLDIDTLRSRYGLLETVAGTGLVDRVNGWSESFEGEPGTAAELSRPHMAMADAAGNIYIADKEAHGVRRLDASGVITTVAGTNVAGFDGDAPRAATAAALDNPNGLWVRDDGTFYILDLGNDRVRAVDIDGQIRTLFEIGGAGAGRGLWVADDETLAYVAAGTRLLRWTPDGGVEVLASGFSSLANLHVAPDGTLGVTDRGAHLVYALADDGTRTVIAGNGTTDGGGDGMPALETGLDEVRGIWFHPEGGALLATHDGSQIWYLDVAGYVHLMVDGDKGEHSGDGEPYDSPGEKISEARAVTMDGAGNILITERDEGHVRRVNIR